MKKPLSQITIDFLAEPGQQPAVALVQADEDRDQHLQVLTYADPSTGMPGQAGAGVGVRLKTLKGEQTGDAHMIAPAEEEQEEKAAADEPAAESPAKSKRGRKSLKQSAAEADLICVPEDEVLFSKQYYTMGEVAAMFRVNQSLLRFWETEFSILQPRKNKKGDRYFRPVDIKNLHLIHHLLRQRKYTIEGAKEFLKKNKKAEERFEAIQRLQQVKDFLLAWKAQL